MNKQIIRDGIPMYYCPDCDDYCLREEMSKSKNRKDGIGTYCQVHKKLRLVKSKKKSIKRKNESYKLGYQVNNHKYYFKGPKRIITVSIRPRATGICVNWGKPKYERRMFIDGI